MNPPCNEAEAMRTWEMTYQRINEGWRITYHSPCGMWELNKIITYREVEYHARMRELVGMKP